ncbi:MAG: cell division protein FtsX, partial [Xanthobacteraceae bacterium]
MSTTEPLDGRIDTLAEPWDDLEFTPLRAKGPRVASAIVPKGSIAGRSLAAVVAIMTFLAALTAGAVMLVVGAASDWRSDIAREVTIQVRPVPGRDLEADVRKAVEITRAARGIASVRAYTKEESARLVQPWLGSGLNLDDLPIPRLIVVKLWSDAPPDLSALRQTLAAQVPSASLDDHRRWIDRMRNMAGAAAIGGLVILALVLAVTVLSVTFATRGAMAANRPIIEVLHYIGATDGFVARQFQRHFLILG